jgi:hypothetical protein
MIKIRVIQIIHCPILVKILLPHIKPLLPYGFSLYNKPAPKEVPHRLGEVLFFGELIKRFGYGGLTLVEVQFQELG